LTRSDQTPPRSATAALLSIGDELTLGQTLDTNSAWLADRLFAVGVRVVEHATVEDDLERMVGALRRLCGAADLVICTGGLGPTADDLTREAVAALVGDELVEDAEAVSALEAWFTARGGMPERNRVQALRPSSGVCLENPNGTAPGLRVLDRARSVEVFALPGPPHEMRPMFDRFVEPVARGMVSGATRARLLLTFGLGESRVAELLGDLMDRDRESRGLAVIGTTASLGVVTCRIRATAGEAGMARAMLDDAEGAIRARFASAGVGGIVFDRRDLSPAKEGGGDSGEIRDALPRAVVDGLRERDERVAVVESCTGGMLGGALTGIAGSSDVFVGGWQTYSNAMKSAMVGVPEWVLAEHGAVSAECALTMARGALDRLAAEGIPCEHALSVTGIAGPGGGSDAKPVGTVWIGLASRDGGDIHAEARRFLFRGGREAVRGWSVRAALGMLRLRLRVCR
jgi:nicotinamide-nucleotide amidase